MEHRHQFDGSNTEFLKIGNFFDHTGKGAAFFLSDAGTRMAREAAHMHFIYDGPGRGPIEWRVILPVICKRINDDTLHRHRGIVTLPSCRFATIILWNHGGASIWVDQDFVRIEAHSISRSHWPLNSIAAEVARLHNRN